MSSRAHRARIDPWSAWVDYAMGVGESWFTAMYPTQRSSSAAGRSLPSGTQGASGATADHAGSPGGSAAAPVAPALRR